MKYKSPFEVIAKAPKNAPISTLLAVWDDIRTVLEIGEIIPNPLPDLFLKLQELFE